ncbi:hypothetical protein HK100_003350 [Physocladia obscura]|uniref:AB hydrolase-1 domain-containing protein n=1 Tax=Physocladia obscura TaxID=109957 RepID=A0AAD5T6R8_9FUNG|nr:hypothetical protein HK100_003350 [Physocladia obscura]
MTYPERRKIWKRILKHKNLEHFLFAWFYWSDSKIRLVQSEYGFLRRDNFADWLAWSLFSESSYENLVGNRANSKVSEIEEVIESVEKKLGIVFQPGRNPKISAVTLNHNIVDAYPKPLIFYVVMKGLEIVERIFLRKFGFRRVSETKNDTLSYWIHTSASKNKLGDQNTQQNSTIPLVFIHGIGVGLFQYLSFASFLVKTQNRPIFLIELPYVSMRLKEKVPTPKQTVQEIERILDSYGYQKAHVVGHSWGTAVVSWMIKYSTFTASAVLLDPIVFFVTLPDLAFNFVHRIPGYNTVARANEYLLHSMCARELHISMTISRKFRWNENLLWPEELPEHHFVVGARQDMLLDGNLMEKCEYQSYY